LLCGLESMRDMGIRNVDAFGDSRLIVQQMTGERQESVKAGLKICDDG
jgi:ribonuclease HI